MENKELNQKKNYINVVKVFKSNGIERKFESGQILSSLEYVPEEVFIIKEGNARLISKINGKLTSISKLGKGDFIGIASILNGLSIEEARASNDLVVYSLKVQEFIKLYQEKVDIKNYCDNNIWISEILYILKNFPKLFKKNLLTSTNLLDQFYRQSKLIPPELNVLNNLLKSEQILFSSYFSENHEIWSEIKTYSQIKKIFKTQSQFPIRIISVPKKIESIKINDSNKSKKEEDKKNDVKEIVTIFNIT